MSSVTDKQLESILQSKGLKRTQPRLDILRFLVKEHRPVSAVEIIENFKDSSINKVTIYRTLDSFVDKKIINKVEHVSDHKLYEIHLLDDCEVNHPHFSCKICEKVSCIEQLGHMQMMSTIMPAGYKVEEVRFHIQGICPACNEKIN